MNVKIQRFCWGLCAGSAFLTFALNLTGCGQIEKTLQLTEDVKELSDQMARRTALLQRQSRQSVAQQTRQGSLEIIRQSDPPIEIKFKESATYFHAFEFQLWENILDEDEILRQNLMALAVKEFFVSYRGIMGGKYSDPDPLQKTGKMPSLMALSATMEQMNQLQIDASIRPGTGFKAVSMLDMVYEGLTAKYDYEHNPKKTFPSFVKEVLYFEDEAAYSLELRYNILAALVMDKLTAQHDLGFFEKLDLLLTAVKVSGSWNCKLERLNAAELSESVVYLNEAMKARNVLKSLGKRAKLNSKIDNLMDRIKYTDDPNAGDRKIQETENLKNAIKIFQQGS